MNKQQERAAKIIDEIVSLQQRVERVAERLKTKLSEVEKSLGDSSRYASSDYWRLVAFADGMVKVRLIIEQNFHFIETFGILATTRYMLELLIWLRLLKSSETWYCFTYAKQLITDKRDHAKEHLAKVRSEINLFKQLERKESEESIKVIRHDLATSRSDLLPDAIRTVMEENDRSARRQFCLYSEDAKTQGFGFQAYLMETKIIPQIETEIEQFQALKTNAVAQMPRSVQGHKPWKWKERAAAAGMIEQFEFVYAYTSRLLHATPTSLTTNQKNLDWHEIVMFLDFLYVSMLDAIEMAEYLADLKPVARISEA
ncbi:MAG TPA: hypothetical protein VIJ79_10035 [Acidobacteriaceae bacterium]